MCAVALVDEVGFPGVVGLPGAVLLQDIRFPSVSELLGVIDLIELDKVLGIVGFLS